MHGVGRLKKNRGQVLAVLVMVLMVVVVLEYGMRPVTKES